MNAHLPDFAEFEQLARGMNLVPVYRRLVSDTLTPVSASCRLEDGPNSFLFESVVGGERIGRYSFLGAGPFLQVDAYDREVVLTRDGQVERQTVDDPLQFLHDLLQQYRAPLVTGLPRFCGGAVGYAGYDTVRYSEHLPNPPQNDRHLPDMSFAFYDRMVVFDQIQKTILVVAFAKVDGSDLRAAYDAACQRVDETCQRLAAPSDDLHLADISRQLARTRLE